MCSPKLLLSCVKYFSPKTFRLIVDYDEFKLVLSRKATLVRISFLCNWNSVLKGRWISDFLVLSLCVGGNFNLLAVHDIIILISGLWSMIIETHISMGSRDSDGSVKKPVVWHEQDRNVISQTTLTRSLCVLCSGNIDLYSVLSFLRSSTSMSSCSTVKRSFEFIGSFLCDCDM